MLVSEVATLFYQYLLTNMWKTLPGNSENYLES